jgi:adenylate cyclase
MAGATSTDAEITTPEGKPSIAVLPLINLSDEPGHDAFVDGMVEEIATALTRFRSLFVVAGGSGLSLKGRGLTPHEAGRLLGVRYLLDGAVHRAADRVAISVNLIDARDGVQLWADRFDGTMADIFSLQDDVALGAAARIEPKAPAEEMRRAQPRPAPDPEAYDLFLRARALASSFSREGVQEALPLYERSLELDPGNARALVGCAAGLAVMVIFGCADEDRLRALAQERLQAALRLAPDDAEVLAIAAHVLSDLGGDTSAARALADQAIVVNPGHAHGWRASGSLRATHPPAEPDIAAERLEHCVRLDPLSPRLALTLTGLGVARLGQRRLDDAIALFHQSAQLLPGYSTNYQWLALCHAQLRQFAEAHEAAAGFRAISGVTVQAFADRVGASDWMKSRLARIASDI